MAIAGIESHTFWSWHFAMCSQSSTLSDGVLLLGYFANIQMGVPYRFQKLEPEESSLYVLTLHFCQIWLIWCHWKSSQYMGETCRGLKVVGHWHQEMMDNLTLNNMIRHMRTMRYSTLLVCQTLVMILSYYSNIILYMLYRWVLSTDIKVQFKHSGYVVQHDTIEGFCNLIFHCWDFNLAIPSHTIDTIYIYLCLRTKSCTA